jgi:hypothetical protein
MMGLGEHRLRHFEAGKTRGKFEMFDLFGGI